MANLIRSLRSSRRNLPAVRDITTLDDYAAAVNDLVLNGASAWGFGPGQVQWQHEPAERISHSFEGYARQLYESDGLVYAVMGVRILAFSLVRFTFQRMRNGRPSALFGTPSLQMLERPWTGGTTQDLLVRVMQDADLAGNAYVTRAGPDLVRLRPDWVNIILAPITSPGGAWLGWRRVGYTYHEGGVDLCPPERVALFDVGEVAHFAPRTAPDANFRGESWLTAVVREITNDKMMERHKTKFFENAATPNISVALSDAVGPDQFQEFKEKMDITHRGVENAYKTLFLGGGADVKVIGANLAQIDFSSIQGRGETRVCAAAGVPAEVVGLSEGLNSSANANYQSAIKRFGQLTMASLWANACGSFETLVPPPGSDSRLWYDTRDIAFLREDEKSRADVQAVQASTVSVYITAGFSPESAVAAVQGEDMNLLEHSGLVSVQLQEPGAVAGAPGSSVGSTDPGSTGSPGTATGAGTPGTTNGAGTAGSAPARTDERERNGHVGHLDDTDRVLLAANAHPHPRLALTEGGTDADH